MANINEFKGSFTEMARPNRYRVNVDGVSNLEFMAKASQLPGSTLGVLDVPYQGRVIKLAGDRTFADWTITVFNDNSMSARREFEAWQELMNGKQSNVGSTVKREASVEQLGRDGEVLLTFKLQGVFPLDLAPIELGFDSNDTVSEFAVTLAFDAYELV
jgi:hypothetical protein